MTAVINSSARIESDTEGCFDRSLRLRSLRGFVILGIEGCLDGSLRLRSLRHFSVIVAGAITGDVASRTESEGDVAAVSVPEGMESEGDVVVVEDDGVLSSGQYIDSRG